MGKTRFTLPTSKKLFDDIAIKHLIDHESRRGGFEYPARAYFDAHLQHGGVFIDVGARWSEPAEVVDGADQRACLTAEHIPPGSNMMDLGAGSRRLGAALPPGGKYLTADLARFASAGEILDLNQGHFPEHAVDVVAAVELVQYIHDVPALL